jgi:putative aldouronate transport system substrate-binding protein
MKKKTLSRREFIRLTLLTAAGGALASCTPAATATTAPAAAVDWKSLVTVPTVPKRYDGVKISTYYPGHASYKYVNGDTETDNVNSRRQIKNLGLEYPLWSEGGDEAYKADIASNKLPDKWKAIQTDLVSLVDNDQVEDITALWEKYASPQLIEKKQYPKGKGWVPTRINGKLYGIAFNYGGRSNIDMLGMIRQDFLDKLSLKMPTTIDEFEATMKAFLDAKLCTIGLPCTKTLTSWYFGIDPIFGAYETMKGIWAKTADGKLAYSSIDPKIKQPLATLAKWYKAGLLDQNFATNTETEAAASSINAGLFFTPHWNSPNPQSAGASGWDIKQKFPQAVLTNKMPLPKGPTGKNGRLSYYDTGNMIAFKKGIDPLKVEAFIAQMNWNMEMHVNFPKYYQWGEISGGIWDATGENFEYITGADGELTKGPVFGQTYAYYGDIGGTTPYLCYPDWQMDSDLLFADLQKKDPSTLSPIQRFAVKVIQIADYLQVTTDGVPGYYNEFIGVPSQRMQTNVTTLSDLENTAFAEIISGAKPVDSAFDEFVTAWKASGGDIATQDVNAWWDQNKT